MKKLRIVLLGIFLSATTTNLMAAGDASQGKEKAMACFSCHGVDGISTNNIWPNLAGQKYDYLVKQLNDFKQGKRNDPLMKGIASTLSEQDIKDLSTYYSTLK